MSCIFEAKLDRHPGVGTWTFVTAPFSIEEEFGKRGRIAIVGKIDGQEFRGSFMPNGDGGHFIVVKKEIREAIGKEAGSTVRVEVVLDTQARVVDIPEEFATALAKKKKVKAAFEALSYSHRKEYVDWISSTKKSETRQRRIVTAMAMIAAGRRLKSAKPGGA
jgi:hypothetical protein